MNRIVVCMDCPSYQTGGWCRLKSRTIGPLWEACEKAGQTKEEIIAEQRNILTKTCTRCKRELPVDSFSANSKAHDGRQSICKECSAELYKAWDEARKARKQKDNEAIKDFKQWKESNKNDSKMETLKTNPTEPADSMPTPYPTKVCTKCGETLPHSEFYKDKKATDGLKSWCKKCHMQAVAEGARKARAEKRAKKQALVEAETTAFKDGRGATLTDKEMVDILREHGWTVTCYRTITEEL